MTGGLTSHKSFLNTETFKLFLNDDILNKILHYSREKANSLGINIVLDIDQLKAYISILNYRGLNHDQKVPIKDLWSEDYSCFYRAAMSRNLFQIWSRILRFDDIQTREERKQVDKFAAMREGHYGMNDFGCFGSQVPQSQLMSS